LPTDTPIAHQVEYCLAESIPTNGVKDAICRALFTFDYNMTKHYTHSDISSLRKIIDSI
jgi:hypothetical protein